MKNGKSRSRVFVANLSSDATSEEIRSLFEGIAPPPLTIASYRSGSAILEFQHPKTAAAAIRMLDGLEFAGRRLRLTAGPGPR
jgi:RNA recognition motif-containing protein